ncbi:MAG TPA: hypothetical protein VG963_09900, partial [Polyangiaceae bacterium]|nr:hypothetical protein [Polyangiaceae bacterium]
MAELPEPDGSGGDSSRHPEIESPAPSSVSHTHRPACARARAIRALGISASRSNYGSADAASCSADLGRMPSNTTAAAAM